MQNNRQCGECTACCYTHAVESLNKPRYEWCNHIKIGKGCSIYQVLPEACQIYRCSWLNGLGNEDLRPDKCGFVLNLYENVCELDKLFHIYEFEKKALLKPIVMEIIDYISDLNIPIILISENKKNTIFKKNLWNELSKELKVAYEDFSKVLLLE